MTDRDMTKKILPLILFCLFLAPGSNAPAQRQIPQSQQQINLSYAPLVKQAAPAVVNIYTKKRVKVRGLSPLFNDPFFKQFFGNNLFPGLNRERVENSLGSGIIVKSDGLVITNYHVIKDSAEITVVLSDKREFPAHIVLTDEKTDLATLRIDTQGESLPTLPLSNSDDLQVGDLVLAIGNPFGVGQTVTSGIVSATARTTVGITDYQFFIQTDAAINPGNSGGALINMRGELVGINTAIFSSSGGSHGIGFATPSNMAHIVIQSALTGDRVIRPWLGLTSQKITSDLAQSLGLKAPKGVLVNALHSESPATRAGIKVGDVITSINNIEINDPQALRFRVATYPVGSNVILQLSRNGKPHTVTMKLIAPPENPPRDSRTLSGTHPLAGATIANLSPAVSDEIGLNTQEQGVVITKVTEGYASRFGFAIGDIIRDLNGTNIETTRQLEHLLPMVKTQWRISYIRDGKLRSLVVGR